MLRLSEVSTHPQRQGNDSSPANEKFHLCDRRRRRTNVSQQHKSLKLFKDQSSERSDRGCEYAVLCAGASPCCSQTHPHRNPTDTCCEICLLCAERRKVRGKNKVAQSVFFGTARSSLCCVMQSIQEVQMLSTYQILPEVMRSGDEMRTVRSRRFPLPLFTQAQYGAHPPRCAVAAGRACSRCHRQAAGALRVQSPGSGTCRGL